LTPTRNPWNHTATFNLSHENSRRWTTPQLVTTRIRKPTRKLAPTTMLMIPHSRPPP
jgi:hypothetical protein